MRRLTEWDILWALFYIFIFPGFLFISFFAMTAQYIDRKLAARFQKRKGPPFIQPIADFFKLLSKEDIVPREADQKMFSLVPIFGLAAVFTAFLYIPMYMLDSPVAFEADLLVVLYLITIPTLALFLAGWQCGSTFGQVGSMRAITQMISYEIPFFIAMLAPALVVGSWSFSEILEFQVNNYWLVLITFIGLFVAIIALQGKLERIPFDTPEAETEIVGGTLVEYSGRRLALFKFMIDVEMIAGAALIAILFLGGGDLFFDASGLNWLVANLIGFIILLIKIIIIVLILSLIRVAVARFRIDQMVKFCYKFLIPLALLQVVIILALKYLEWV